jgi:hypothetical protein
LRRYSFQRQMCIDATKTHGADTSAKGKVSGPESALLQDPKDQWRSQQLRVRLITSGRRGQDLVMKRQGGLDEPGNTGCRLGVAHVRLDGPNCCGW